MATQRPISTISYNSKGFLLEKVQELYNSHIISLYMIMPHKGEDGDKDHFHVFLQPNTRIDPMSVRDLFKEYVKDNPKPLTVRPFRPSKEEDWILYAVHDSEYLLQHGEDRETGKISYEWQDMICPDDFDMENAFIRARATMKHSSASLAKRIMNGERPSLLALEGMNPFTIRGVLSLLAEDQIVDVVNENRVLKDRIRAIEDCLLVQGFEIIEKDGQLSLVQQLEIGVKEDAR